MRRAGTAGILKALKMPFLIFLAPFLRLLAASSSLHQRLGAFAPAPKVAQDNQGKEVKHTKSARDMLCSQQLASRRGWEGAGGGGQQ